MFYKMSQHFIQKLLKPIMQIKMNENRHFYPPPPWNDTIHTPCWYASTVMISSYFPLGRVTWPLGGWFGGGGVGEVGLWGVKMFQWEPHVGRRELPLTREGEADTIRRAEEEGKESSWRRGRRQQNPSNKTRSEPGPRSEPPCQSPSNDETPASSSCRTSSGEKGKTFHRSS